MDGQVCDRGPAVASREVSEQRPIANSSFKETGSKLSWRSDDGFRKPTLIPYNPTASVQVPSNVTRISHALRRVGLDGIPQIILYHSGVGTGSTKVDLITGGLLGVGISEVGIFSVWVRVGSRC